MAAAECNFEVVQIPENSLLTLLHVIRCRGRFQPDGEIATVPTLVSRCGKPFTGPIPPGRPVFDIDVSAEQAELTAALTPEPIDHTRFTNDELMDYMHWDVSQYVQARDICELPKVDSYRDATGNLLGGPGQPTRKKVAIDAWADA